MSWLLASHNTIFAAAFALLLWFALLEGISLVMGLGISHFLGDLLGLEHGTGHLPADAPDGPAAPHSPDAPEAGTGEAAPLLSWLEVGKVPLLVSVCAFLAAFSIGGMVLQQGLILTGPGPLIQPAAAALAFFLALPALKYSNRLLGRCWPKDETSSFPSDLLIGRVGVVTIGTASPERTAEVKVTGPDGRPHYVMSFVRGEKVPTGGEVLLERRDAATGNYHGVKNENPDLSPSLYL